MYFSPGEREYKQIWEKKADGVRRVAKKVIEKVRVVCQKLRKHGRGQKKYKMIGQSIKKTM